MSVMNRLPKVRPTNLIFRWSVFCFWCISVQLKNIEQKFCSPHLLTNRNYEENYYFLHILLKFNRSLCVNCGRCYISCYDAGHQALRMDEKTGKPVMDAKKCVGCQLCKVVCPTGAISAGVRVEKIVSKSKESEVT